MIGYDLDGVLGPDFIETDNLDELLRVRDENLRPLFNPPGEWVLITGRPVGDKKSTTKWIAKFFDNPPIQIYHKNKDMKKAAEYKAKVINKIDNLKLFIESDINQVDIIVENVTIPVIHFETMMVAILNELQGN